jgi:hypothetical protein
LGPKHAYAQSSRFGSERFGYTPSEPHGCTDAHERASQLREASPLAVEASGATTVCLNKKSPSRRTKAVASLGTRL